MSNTPAPATQKGPEGSPGLEPQAPPGGEDIKEDVRKTNGAAPKTPEPEKGKDAPASQPASQPTSQPTSQPAEEVKKEREELKEGWKNKIDKQFSDKEHSTPVSRAETVRGVLQSVTAHLKAGKITADEELAIKDHIVAQYKALNIETTIQAISSVGESLLQINRPGFSSERAAELQKLLKDRETEKEKSPKDSTPYLRVSDYELRAHFGKELEKSGKDINDFLRQKIETLTKQNELAKKVADLVRANAEPLETARAIQDLMHAVEYDSQTVHTDSLVEKLQKVAPDRGADELKKISELISGINQNEPDIAKRSEVIKAIVKAHNIEADESTLYELSTPPEIKTQSEKTADQIIYILNDLQGHGLNWDHDQFAGERFAYDQLLAFEKERERSNDPESLSQAITFTRKLVAESAQGTPNARVRAYMQSFDEKFERQYGHRADVYQNAVTLAADYSRTRRDLEPLKELEPKNYRERLFGSLEKRDSLISRLKATNDPTRELFAGVLKDFYGKHFLLDFQEHNATMADSLTRRSNRVFGTDRQPPIPKADDELKYVGEVFYPRIRGALEKLSDLNIERRHDPSKDPVKVLEELLKNDPDEKQLRAALEALAPLNLVKPEDRYKPVTSQPSVQADPGKTATAQREQVQLAHDKLQNVINNFQTNFNPTYLNGLDSVNLPTVPDGVNRRHATKLFFADAFYADTGVPPVSDAIRYHQEQLNQRIEKIDPRSRSAENRMAQERKKMADAVTSVASGIYSEKIFNDAMRLLKSVKEAEAGNAANLTAELSNLDAMANGSTAQQMDRTATYSLAMQLNANVVQQISNIQNIQHPSTKHAIEVAKEFDKLLPSGDTTPEQLNAQLLAAASYLGKEGDIDPVAVRMAMVLFDKNEWAARNTGMPFMQFLASTGGVAGTEGALQLQQAMLPMYGSN